MAKLIALMILVVIVALYVALWLFNHGHLLVLGGGIVSVIFIVAIWIDKTIKKLKG